MTKALRLWRPWRLRPWFDHQKLALRPKGASNPMNSEQRLADIEHILAELASTVRVLGDH